MFLLIWVKEKFLCLGLSSDWTYNELQKLMGKRTKEILLLYLEQQPFTAVFPYTIRFTYFVAAEPLILGTEEIHSYG